MVREDGSLNLENYGVDTGIYANHLENWYKHFHRDQVGFSLSLSLSHTYSLSLSADTGVHCFQRERERSLSLSPLLLVGWFDGRSGNLPFLVPIGALVKIFIANGDKLIRSPWKELNKIESFLQLNHSITRDHFFFNTTKVKLFKCF